MISCEMDRLTPSARRLVKHRVASRVATKDATLYSYSAQAQACAENFMGWADLATNPPTPVADIAKLADDLVAEGIAYVVLVGQGGSTQAPMTITKYNKEDDRNRVDFRTIDSMSPVRVRELFATIDPAHTLFILASKSGSTIEPRVMLAALRAELTRYMPAAEIPSHLAAITDPGSQVHEQATREGWRAVLTGEPTVGGRFSALSVFGLFPAALVGVDLPAMIATAREAEARCGEDTIDNPAVCLAAFLYDNYLAGRNKFSFLTPKRGRVLGLWIEQLVAESVGKDGKGILPNIEIDPLLLAKDPGDRCVIMYQTKNDLWDERKNFEMSLSYVDHNIPTLNFRINSVVELAEHFVVWEYAIAMCGWLMKVSPFDQPDVADTKARVLQMLEEGLPQPHFTEEFAPVAPMGEVEVRVSPALQAPAEGEGAAVAPATLEDALFALFSSVEKGDYFALNGFLPFTGEGRREALETIRHRVAASFGVPSCIEVGPRYLHSTGQLQKGGPNQGVFLVISADELKDIPLAEEAPSLGELAKTQAIGDWTALSERGRRAVHVHLPDNTAAALRALADMIENVIIRVKAAR